MGYCVVRKVLACWDSDAEELSHSGKVSAVLKACGQTTPECFVVTSSSAYLSG